MFNLLHEGPGVAISVEGDTAWMCHEYNVSDKEIDRALEVARTRGYELTSDDYINTEGDVVLVLSRA